KSLDLLEVKLLCFVHAGCQSSACHPLQAHLVLETASSFRLILYWTRLGLAHLKTLSQNRSMKYGWRLRIFDQYAHNPYADPRLSLKARPFAAVEKLSSTPTQSCPIESLQLPTPSTQSLRLL